jgi:hypothetical protein
MMEEEQILQSSVIIQNNGSIGVIVSVDFNLLASFTVADAARDGVDMPRMFSIRIRHRLINLMSSQRI